MAIKVEINYDRRKNEVEVYANDDYLELPYLQGKLIQEWFKEVTVGNRVWKGLLVELKERINYEDIVLEFISDAKSKDKFYGCLVEQGVDIDEEDEGLFISLNYVRIAHNNYETAMYYLDIDEELAHMYFMMSAKHGHVRAQYELGKCYAYGIGGDFDEEQAIFWFKKAIEQGCIEASEELSIIQEEDEETKKYNREMLMLTEQFNSINGLNTALLDLDE